MRSQIDQLKDIHLGPRLRFHFLIKKIIFLNMLHSDRKHCTSQSSLYIWPLDMRWLWRGYLLCKISDSETWINLFWPDKLDTRFLCQSDQAQSPVRLLITNVCHHHWASSYHARTSEYQNISDPATGTSLLTTSK